MSDTDDARTRSDREKPKRPADWRVVVVPDASAPPPDVDRARRLLAGLIADRLLRTSMKGKP